MTDFDMRKTGQRLKDLRLGHNLSQAKLADLVGVAQNTIAQYENGAKPSIEVIFKLAVALNTTADYLLGLED